MPRVGEAELAKALSRDRMAIRAAERVGRISKGPDGLYDLDEAVADFMATTHHEKGHNNRAGSARSMKQAVPSGTLPDIPAPEIPLPTEAKSTAYAKARAGTQIYEALLKKLRYEERAKNLTPTADVEQARFTEFRTLREACFNIPARVAALLATETSVEKCQQLLEAELHSVFSAFAEGKLAA
jgi:hypothetical protein